MHIHKDYNNAKYYISRVNKQNYGIEFFQRLHARALVLESANTDLLQNSFIRHTIHLKWTKIIEFLQWVYFRTAMNMHVAGSIHCVKAGVSNVIVDRNLFSTVDCKRP